MKGVNFVHMQNIENGMYSDTKTEVGRNCRWVTARPSGYHGIKHRLMAAWLVFTGKADVLYWDEQ